jgi:uncharacterized protein YqjF (DUF2071 family)
MFPALKNHPFAVDAFFERSLVLTFAVEKDKIQHLIPPCVQLDTYKDHWAFIAVAMVETKDLRPSGVPGRFGNDFFLIGYRVFVRYVTNEGKRLRGLYILKSQTDKKRMELFGNIFTHYNYTTTDIDQKVNNGVVEISSVNSRFKVIVETDVTESIDLPESSPFSEWKEARKFAGPLPFTFTYDPQTKNVLIVEGVRANWTPRPVKVLHYRFSFLEQMDISLNLANAFIIENIPYHWKKGKVEKWRVA